MERPNNSAAEFRPVLNKKGRKGAKFYQNCFPSHIFSNSREVSEKYCYFPTHTDKNSVFLEPKFLQKGKIIGGLNFFPQRLNFYSGLAEKFCKELATLDQGGVYSRGGGDEVGGKDLHRLRLESGQGR
jgi:hypothetical protein